MRKEVVVDSVLLELERCAAADVVVFWIEEFGNRDDICSELTNAFRGNFVASVVLRHLPRAGRQLFTDPNAWAADVMAVVDSERAQVEQVFSESQGRGPLGLVIIARNKLAVTQSSSPATAPDWCPIFGGRSAMVFLRDVVTISNCSLSAEEAAAGQIKDLLYQIDRGLLRVAKMHASNDRHHGIKLWDQALRKRSGASSRSDFLDLWERGLDGVTDSESYRPSLKSGWSMVAAMWECFMVSSPSQLLGNTGAFADYLGLDAQWVPGPPAAVSLLPIVFRSPEDLSKGGDAVAARSVIMMVGVACQFVTAAAHADQYGRVGADSLDALSREIRTFLTRLEHRASLQSQT
ncbi:hypothetical protein [Stenotrophomonas riyadhensis]